MLRDVEDGMNNLDVMQSQFSKINEYPYYLEMLKLGTKVIGVWDDHDYGLNDAG